MPKSITLPLLLILLLLPIITALSPNHLRRRKLVHRHLRSLSSPSSSPSPLYISAASTSPHSHVFHATDFGADPTGSTDSSSALSSAISAALSFSHLSLTPSIPNLGGAELHLDGGLYLLSSPLSLPSSGNLKIHSGTLLASNTFPSDRHLIELNRTTSSYAFEYITLAGLMLDSNFRGGGIAVIDSLRVIIDGCYIVHFTSVGVLIRNGHDNAIRNCYIGQHITAGSDPAERSFTGTGIQLNGNDNAVTDVIIFSAAVGILVAGEANVLTGVHCYNKAAAFGGTGIYVKLPGLTQTRIVNCYLDFTGIVAEDPVQLLISGSFFLGDANVAFKSVNGVINGVSVVDNMFTGRDSGAHNVWLDETAGGFKAVDGVVVDRNSVRRMVGRSTVARGTAEGNGTMWTVDFSRVLLFPNRIDKVEYSVVTPSGFPGHAVRSVESNRVVIVSDAAVAATVHVEVSQAAGT
ncbi:polygalacturonase QRT3-like [Phalaenopsis equestris]|uniref:polygalacturonase QRT3-like n=1 Tax=Phalaenopsis equestris TaxID=78828 RepID=UPI0009E3D0DB|nr:polygalacturonase QRT3-like [Phalaenopsis equestris]